MSQQPRLDFHALAPDAAKALTRFSFAARGRLEPRLKELITLRISQINGCAFCIDMHWAALLKLGMEPRHINAVAGWREAQRFFSAGERAALNWAEAVNALPHRVTSNEELEEMRQHFSDAQIADVTFVVAAIRAWNMLNATFHMPVPEVPFVAQ
jgi:AhpD family alkylhydroperoxidase